MADSDNLSILLVDDHVTQRLMMSTALASAGFRIVGQAENGRDGVEKFMAHKPDITLLDIEMPVMNGISALKEIMAADPKAFVLMMSSVGNTDIIDDCLMAGAYHYIRKDLPVNEVAPAIMDNWRKAR